MALLQKRSLYALLLEIIWAGALIVVFITQWGATKYDTSAKFRLTMDGMWVGGLILYWWLFSSLTKRPDKFDERDKTIL